MSKEAIDIGTLVVMDAVHIPYGVSVFYLARAEELGQLPNFEISCELIILCFYSAVFGQRSGRSTQSR
jgi:hypothetical protein